MSSLLLLLLAALRLQRRFQPRGHFVHCVACGTELIVCLIADGCVEISVLYPLHTRNERVQRRLNVPEQVPRQIKIVKPTAVRSASITVPP